jgi:hypothetical protein
MRVTSAFERNYSLLCLSGPGLQAASLPLLLFELKNFLIAACILPFAGQPYFLYKSRWPTTETTVRSFSLEPGESILTRIPVLAQIAVVFALGTTSFKKRVAASRSCAPPSHDEEYSTIQVSLGASSIDMLGVSSPKEKLNMLNR